MLGITRLRRWWTQRILHRKRIPLPLWRQVIKQQPLLSQLDKREARRLRRLASLFLHQKTLVGAGGLELNDFMRVTGFGPWMLRLNKTPWSVRLYEYFENKLPGTFEGVGDRKLFMEEQVLAAIEAGATQVLVMGAGFDTLCLRLAPQFSHIQFFEVDHPATSAAKAKGVMQEGQPENMTLLAANLSKIPLSTLMQETERWDTGAQSVVVAEGLLIYLKQEVVHQLFREVAACTGPGTRVVFSHGIKIENYPFANALMRLIGEPWLSSCEPEDLPGYIGEGWSVIMTKGWRVRTALEGVAVAEKP